MAGAITQDGPEITLPANAQLNEEQFHILEIMSTGYVDLATDPNDNDNNLLIGVLQNKPHAQGSVAVVRVGGISKVMSGDTIAIGSRVTTDGSGHADNATDFDNVIGIAVSGGTSGEIMEVLLNMGCHGRPDG